MPVGRLVHLNSPKSRPRDFYELVVGTVEGDFVGINQHAIADYGFAVSHCDSELAALRDSTYVVPRNLDRIGGVQRRNTGHQGGERQESDASESGVFHS